MLEHVVVVGASLAGLRAAEALRSEGFAGMITLIGAETALPYDRPPLSKKVLAGDWEPDRIVLRKPEALADLRLELRLGTRAAGLDLAGRLVHLADGSSVPYDGLVIATGAVPRRLPNQPDLAGVHVLRTLDDALGLRADLDRRPARVVVIGAGFIGAEVAATARGRGLEVTVLEAAPVPLVRGLGSEMGPAVAALHTRHGVDLRLGVGVAGLHGRERVEAVRLVDGSVVEAECVVVGIGVRPATDWLDGSGLDLRDGVVCEPTLRAAPLVYAAGDLARFVHPLYDDEVRMEHWTAAAEQGARAARNLLAEAAGEPGEPYGTVPFFWSDQYDVKIQFLGRGGDGDDVRVVHGQADEDRFVALYGRAGRLRGVLGLGRPKLVMPFQRHLATGMSWDDALAFAATQQT